MLFFNPMRDNHIHTALCKHACGTMEEYVVSAIEKGLKEICFTDHIPLPNNFDLEHRMSMKEMDVYMDGITDLKRKFREIDIYVGIEADYSEGLERYLERFFKQYPFDVVILSVHFIQKWRTGEWVFRYNYTPQTIQRQYREYFDVLVKGIHTGLFDVVGHMDIIKRPRFPVMRSNHKQVEKTLEAAKRHKMSIEINTSGLRKNVEEIYPSGDIVIEAMEMGIPLILSSDAHKPEDVGYEFDNIINELFQFPGLKIAYYSQRKPIIRPLVQPVPFIED